VKLLPHWEKGTRPSGTNSAYVSAWKKSVDLTKSYLHPQLSLPLPLSFASGDYIPFTLSLLFPDAPALAQLLASHIRVKLIKRTRIWINAGRDISVRDLCIANADPLQVDRLIEGANLLNGSIYAGMAGRESSWNVDGVSQVQVGRYFPILRCICDWWHLSIFCELQSSLPNILRTIVQASNTMRWFN